MNFDYYFEQVSAVHTGAGTLHQRELLCDVGLQQVAHRLEGVRRERHVETRGADANDEVSAIRVQVCRPVENVVLTTQQRQRARTI